MELERDASTPLLKPDALKLGGTLVAGDADFIQALRHFQQIPGPNLVLAKGAAHEQLENQEHDRAQLQNIPAQMQSLDQGKDRPDLQNWAWEEQLAWRNRVFKNFKMTCVALFEELSRIDGSAAQAKFLDNIDPTASLPRPQRVFADHIAGMEKAMEDGDGEQAVKYCNSMLHCITEKLRSNDTKRGASGEAHVNICFNTLTMQISGLQMLREKQLLSQQSFMQFAIITLSISFFAATGLSFSVQPTNEEPPTLDWTVWSYCFSATLILSMASFLPAIVYQSPELLHLFKVVAVRLSLNQFDFRRLTLVTIFGILSFAGMCSLFFLSTQVRVFTFA